jgi:hypothetical protein
VKPSPIDLEARRRGRRRAVLAVAALASLWSIAAFGEMFAHEWVFFADHAEKKTLLLGMPAKLAEVDREIIREQEGLLKAQAAIRARLGGK